MNNEENKKWIEQNLVRTSDAHLITGQSKNAFKQSVRRGYVQPFVSFKLDDDSTKPTYLYLKEDLERYGNTIKKKNR